MDVGSILSPPNRFQEIDAEHPLRALIPRSDRPLQIPADDRTDPVTRVQLPRAGEQRPDLHESQPDIAIVDDERDAREMLALTLESRGARVRHLGTARDAFDAMLQRRPDRPG